ncbi:TFIID-31kDa-domain-containing protein [Phanerochaete sordida]|uniref:TFIID-31kDa-domain-containing protein n=1 Tax=Phanerochaete sordida TaxID=48140 RepID=A0A9P3L7D2_9APHY|nr:TFIID-31kDa-domain-containing protein [Phanerochaete sordida]
MSRPSAADTLPPTARSIALLLASTPTVQDAQPGVLHQLLEFSHRYTAQVLSDALVYAEHAGRSGKLDMDDIVLAVQARVGWEFGGRIPKEYMLSLAAQTNAAPLPAVPEVFGVRLPPAAECLTNVDFDLVPNRPPPGVTLYDEEVEEVEESDEEDEDMEPAPIPAPAAREPAKPEHAGAEVPAPVGALQSPSDVDMTTPVVAAQEEASDGEDAGGLFSGGEEEEEESGDEAMDTTAPAPEDASAGVKRKLVEEEDYD